jgi:hypothetical protein
VPKGKKKYKLKRNNYEQSNKLFDVHISMHHFNLPAIGGPTVSGIEHNPRMHPIA